MAGTWRPKVIVGVTVQVADEGDTTTIAETGTCGPPSRATPSSPQSTLADTLIGGSPNDHEVRIGSANRTAFAPIPPQRSGGRCSVRRSCRRPQLAALAAARPAEELLNCDPNNRCPHSATGIIRDPNHRETRRHCRASTHRSRGRTVGLDLQRIHSATPLLVSGLVSRLAST
jgi:hypothetical protein